MASVQIWRKVAGVKAELTREDVYALTNTVERLGELVENARAGKRVNATDIIETFQGSDQDLKELELVFELSRNCSMLFAAEQREGVI